MQRPNAVPLPDRILQVEDSVLKPLDDNTLHKWKAKMITKKPCIFLIQNTILTKFSLLFQENLKHSKRYISPKSCTKYD